MAKRLYEEENIRAIAAKIRSLVPSLYKRKFTTEQMPDGIERVYNQGKIIGQNEGHRVGYREGYDEGYSKGNTTGYDNGYNSGYDKGISTGIDTGEAVGYSKGYIAAINSIPRAEGVGF